jgi:hypothetical protein
MHLSRPLAYSLEPSCTDQALSGGQQSAKSAGDSYVGVDMDEETLSCLSIQSCAYQFKRCFHPLRSAAPTTLKLNRTTHGSQAQVAEPVRHLAFARENGTLHSKESS